MRLVSDFACNFQGAKHLLAPTLLYGLARLPQLSLLNTMAQAASSPLFSSTYFHHIIHATSALRASCYDPHCLHQPHHHPHRHRTQVMSLAQRSFAPASVLLSTLSPCDSSSFLLPQPQSSSTLRSLDRSPPYRSGSDIPDHWPV